MSFHELLGYHSWIIEQTYNDMIIYSLDNNEIKGNKFSVSNDFRPGESFNFDILILTKDRGEVVISISHPISKTYMLETTIKKDNYIDEIDVKRYFNCYDELLSYIKEL